VADAIIEAKKGKEVGESSAILSSQI